MKIIGALHSAIIFTVILSLLACLQLNAQQNAENSSNAESFVSDKLVGAINKKKDWLQLRLSKSTEKSLNKMARKEKKMYRKIYRADSVLAKKTFGDIDSKYSQLKNPIADINEGVKEYSGNIDSMTTALKFLDQQNLLPESPGMRSKLDVLKQDYGLSKNILDKTKFIQEEVKERQEFIKRKLLATDLAVNLKNYQKGFYYYKKQVNEIKEVFEQPHKLERRLLQAAMRMPDFQKFFNKNSQLAAIFRLPGNDADLAAVDPGLQSRSIVLNDLQQRLGTGPNVDQAMNNSIGDAQKDLDRVKMRLSKYGNSGADLDMPDFKKNDEKTKTFLKRIELGTNIQSVRSNAFFPTTTDLGLSVGYKFSQNAIAGVGASYKLGWGPDIHHIRMSSEGVGLRTFIDVKLKGSFFLSGGFEYNYQQPFSSINTIAQSNDWRESGLLGMSKILSVKNKTFKRTKLQLLYDLLSIKAVPQRQPVVFRMNYGLK